MVWIETTNPPESSSYTVVPHWYHNSSSADTYLLLLPLDAYHREWYTRVGPINNEVCSNRILEDETKMEAKLKAISKQTKNDSR